MVFQAEPVRINLRSRIREVDFPSDGLLADGWQSVGPDSPEGWHRVALEVQAGDGQCVRAFFAVGPNGSDALFGNLRTGTQVIVLGGFAYVVGHDGVRSCLGSPMGFRAMAEGAGSVWLAMSDGTGLLVVLADGRTHYEPNLSADNLAPVWIEDACIICAGGYDVSHEISLRRFQVLGLDETEGVTIVPEAS